MDYKHKCFVFHKESGTTLIEYTLLLSLVFYIFGVFFVNYSVGNKARIFPDPNVVARAGWGPNADTTNATDVSHYVLDWPDNTKN